jgi:hypothetical protein
MDGAVLGKETFGASAPIEKIQAKFRFRARARHPGGEGATGSLAPGPPVTATPAITPGSRRHLERIRRHPEEEGP